MLKGGMGNLMKQAQQMQEKMKKAQEELSRLEVEGTTGGNLVKVTMTCKHDVKRIELSDNLMGEDKEVIEDMIAAAVNDAVRKVESATAEKMSEVTGGMNIPGMNLPF